MRISDWSSDVCSSDLLDEQVLDLEQRPHQRSFGFRASRSQSPNRLTASTRMASAAPGKMVIHHEPENRKSLPTLTRVPSDGAVAGTPMPRNDRVASVTTAMARLMVAIISSGPMTLGSTPRNMMSSGGMP